MYGVLNAAEAARFVDAVEHSGLLTHQSSRGPKYGEVCMEGNTAVLVCVLVCVHANNLAPPIQKAFRDNERVSVQDEAFAQHLWQASGLQRHFATWPSDGGRPVGLNPNIRIYRYGTGQRFGKHIDESCETGPGQYTRFTLLIYLTGNVGGGETVFYGMVCGGGGLHTLQHHIKNCASTKDERSRLLCRVAPETGKALLHVHGDDCLEHEGAVVRAGLKYVLRSDVVFTKVS